MIPKKGPINRETSGEIPSRGDYFVLFKRKEEEGENRAAKEN